MFPIGDPGGCRTVVGAHVLAGHALALDEILLPELHADTLSVLRPLVVAFGMAGPRSTVSLSSRSWFLKLARVSKCKSQFVSQRFQSRLRSA